MCVTSSCENIQFYHSESYSFSDESELKVLKIGFVQAPACADRMLLTDTLRHGWGWQGYVISDAGAIKFIETDHEWAASQPEAAADALLAGLLHSVFFCLCMGVFFFSFLFPTSVF